MSVETNTIKIVGQTGEFFITPNQTKEYKGITLFGYNYLDWGTKVNQALVTLIDQIDSLQDGNLSEIQFDLESYSEEQKVLRTQEFTIWKTEYKKILQDIVDVSDAEVLETIEIVKQSITDLQNSLMEKINANDLSINEKIEQVENTITTSFNDKLNIELTKVLTLFQEANEKIEISSNLLKDATLALDTAMSNIKSQLEQFKTDFTASFEKFKEDTNNTLVQYKDNIIAYIDEKFGTATNQIETERERIDRIEMLLESVTPEILTNLISSGIDSTAKIIIESYMTNLVSNVEALQTANSNIDTLIQTKIEETTDLKFQQLEDEDDTLNTNINNLKTKVDSHETKIQEVDKFVTDYETLELELFGENDQRALRELFDQVKGIEFLNINNLLKNYSQKIVVEKIKENIALQNLENNKNILTYFDTKFNILMNQLSKTEADEVYLASKISSDMRTNLISNINKNIKDIQNVKSTTESKFLDFHLSSDWKKIYFIFSLPEGMIPTTGKLINRRTGTTIQNGLSWNNTDKFLGSGQTYLGDLVYFKDNNLSSWTILDITTLTLLATDTIGIEINTQNQDGSTGSTLIGNFLVDKFEGGLINSVDLDSIRNYSYVNNPLALTALNSPSIAEVVPSNLVSGIIIPKKEIIENDGIYYLLLRIKLQESYILNSIDLVYNGNTISYAVDNIENVPNDTTSLETLRNTWQFNYFKDIDSTGLLTIPLTGTVKTTKAGATVTITGVVQDIQASIKYNNGTSNITKSITIKSLGGGSSTKFVTATIAPNAYHEIDTNTLFGTSKGKNTLVDVKIKDATTGSETLGMYLNADTITSVAIKDERYIRIYNEFPTTSEFYIAVTPR